MSENSKPEIDERAAAFNDLIERLGQATEDSVDLDIEISHLDGIEMDEVSCPTQYIDDAADLVPENLGFTIHRFLGLDGRSWAAVFNKYEGEMPQGISPRPEIVCSGATPALALTIAALHARRDRWEYPST